MAEWEFEHSIYTKASRGNAWDFWTSFKYHEMDPGVESIELDGPFETGTTGRTVTGDYTQEWELTDVIERKRVVITGRTPDGEGSLIFDWRFNDEGDGTRLTQRIRATGSMVEDFPEELHLMEESVPGAMARLAEELNRLSTEG